jgi:ABC-type sugar transport system permease subunit
MLAQAESAVPPRAQARGARRQPTLVSQDRRLGYLLVAPAVVVLLLVTGYPLIYNLWNSFHHVDYIEPPVGTFAGLSNYSKLFTGNSFIPALEHTVGFTIVSVAVETSIGLALALALNKKFRGRSIVRAAIFIPWAVPTVVSAELFKEMFTPQSGFVNYILHALHLPLANTTWLDEKWTAWTAILIADAWRNTPFIAIVLLAGLQIIPADVYEAARIDGASAWQTFRRITLPMLAPALMVALIFRTLSSFLIFDVVFIMTGGAPGTSTQVLSYIDYEAFLANYDFGLGGAIAVALMIMALIIAFVYVRAFRSSQELR